MSVVARERREDGRIGEVATQTIEVEAGILSHLLDGVDLVDVQPTFMPGAQQGRVKRIESILPPRSLSSHEGEPASDLLSGWGVPCSPAFIFGVHLRQREIAPPNVQGSFGGHAREQQ